MVGFPSFQVRLGMNGLAEGVVTPSELRSYITRATLCVYYLASP